MRHAATAAIVVVGFVLLGFGALSAEGPEADQDESRIQRGLAISPVKPDLTKRNRALVGLGSYIVNAQADCNGCHSLFPPGGAPTEFTPPGNPYLLRPPSGPFMGKIQVNPATYLGGGNDFGPLGPGPASGRHLMTRPARIGKARSHSR